MFPTKIYIKVNEDGSLGRAYLPEQLNRANNGGPPPGVKYVAYSLGDKPDVWQRQEKNDNKDSKAGAKTSVST